MKGTPAIYFKSLNRFFNICGVEKQLFFLNFGLTSTIAFSSKFNLAMCAIAGILFGIGHGVGIALTRVDNQILTVFRRHIHYKKYYAPVSGIHAELPLLRSSVPVYRQGGVA